MLDHLTGPDHVEAGVFERQRPLDRHQSEVQLTVSASGAGQGSLGHLGADDAHAGGGGDRGELAGSASKVKDTVAVAQLVQQKRAA